MKITVLIKIVLILLIGSAHGLAQKTPVIVFEQTPCLGSCAVFKMEIFKNRKINLRADNYVEMGEGTFTYRLTKEEYNKLVKLFHEKEFFQLKDEYTSSDTDLPSRYITFHDGHRSKTILDYAHAPEKLTELEKELFAILSKSNWKKLN